MKQVLKGKIERIYTCFGISASSWMLLLFSNLFHYLPFQTLMMDFSLYRSCWDLSNDTWIIKIWFCMRKLGWFEQWGFSAAELENSDGIGLQLRNWRTAAELDFSCRMSTVSVAKILNKKFAIHLSSSVQN